MVEESTVPVIETGVGNCHVYVDAAADLAMALQILLNAKTSRPSVCNAAESLLVHAAVADAFLAPALPALRAAGVTVHGAPEVGRRTRPTWCRRPRRTSRTEYLSLDLSRGRRRPRWTPRSTHIRRYGTGHTEAIVTGSHRPRRTSSWPRSTRPP